MKCWILEKFYTFSELVDTVLTLEEMNEKNDNKFEERLDEAVKALETKRNGEWHGVEGKTVYKTFCQVAREYIVRNRKHKYQLRVIEAEIPDDSTTWINYTVVKENDKVLRYLYATSH